MTAHGPKEQLQRLKNYFLDKVRQLWFNGWNKLISFSLMYIRQILVLAFAFNAKSFAIAILVFIFLLFLLVTFSGWTAKKLFSQRFMISYQKSVWPRSDSFLGQTKMPFRKYCSTSCYWRRVWHMTHLMHGNQHSKHPKKHNKQSAKNSETS